MVRSHASKKTHQTNNQQKDTQWIRNSQNNLLWDKQNISILLTVFNEINNVLSYLHLSQSKFMGEYSS